MSIGCKSLHRGLLSVAVEVDHTYQCRWTLVTSLSAAAFLRRTGCSMFARTGRHGSVVECAGDELYTVEFSCMSTRSVYAECDHTRTQDHAPVLKSLHWLPVRQRIQYKIATLVQKYLLWMAVQHSTSLTISRWAGGRQSGAQSAGRQVLEQHNLPRPVIRCCCAMSLEQSTRLCLCWSMIWSVRVGFWPQHHLNMPLHQCAGFYRVSSVLCRSYFRFLEFQTIFLNFKLFYF